MPRPQTRDGEISDKLMWAFDRALELRAEIAAREDELANSKNNRCGAERLLPHSPELASAVGK